MIKIITRLQTRFDNSLRKQCDKLSHRTRLIVILSFLTVFGGASLYIFGNAIYQIGKNEGEKIIIEHIKVLPVVKPNNSQNNYGNN